MRSSVFLNFDTRASPIEPQCFPQAFYGIRISRKPFVVFRQNILVSSDDCVGLLTKCFARLQAANWTLSASRIPSSLNQLLLPHHSIKSAEKGPLVPVTKLGIEPVTWCQISKILSSPDKPLSEYILFIQNCLCEVWRIFPGKSQFHSVPHVISSNRN